MISVLFVCLGNICRSPIAEATFRAVVEEKGLSNKIRCDSAGTHNYHIGELPDERTRKNALNHGLNLTHKARKLGGKDFADFEYIVAMDDSNLDFIRAMHNKTAGFYPDADTVFLLREFDPQNTHAAVPAFSVPDPYFGDAQGFEEVYQVVRRSNEQLIAYILEREKLG